MRRTPLGPLLSAIPLAAMLALSACGNVHHIEVGAIPDDYRTRHPIVVGESETAIDIPVASSDRELSGADAGRVADFARRYRQAGAGTVHVLVPYGSPNAHAASRLAQGAASVLRRSGVGRSAILMQSYSAADARRPTPIRLSYTALAAQTAPCGRWPDDLGDTTANKNYFNFGCATQQNLAAQIADPRDLLSPRGMGAVDGERRNEVIERYRRGEATASAASRTESDYSW